jgi:hypothetical protein
MLKAKWIGVAGIVLVTIVALEVVRTRSQVNNQVTKESYDQIVKGMSMEEVRSLLGSSTKDEVASRSNDNYYAASTRKYYVGPTGTISLHVHQGVVLSKEWIDKERPAAAMTVGNSALAPPPPPSALPPPPSALPPPPPSLPQTAAGK